MLPSSWVRVLLSCLGAGTALLYRVHVLRSVYLLRSLTVFTVLHSLYCVPVLRSCTAGATQEFNGSPSIGGDIVYVGSNDRYLHAIDRKTGAFKFKFLTCANVFSSAAVSDAGMVYIGCNTETGG